MKLPLYANPISITISVILVYFGLIKYDFLKIDPYSLNVIANAISDAFVIVNKMYRVIGYNETFKNLFGTFCTDKQNNFYEKFNVDEYKNHIDYVISKKEKNKIERRIKFLNINKYFTIEFIPLLSLDNVNSIIILFRDISELKEAQDKLILNERYVSLGMLMGGIAHNVRSPLMAIGANIDTLQHLACEYEASISDNTVTIEDHQEIAKEMRDWLNKTSQSLEYIGGILNNVKNQIQSNINEAHFKIDELVKYVNQTIQYQQNHKCVLNINNSVDSDIEIKGSISLLTQVIDNLLINSIHSYNDANGAIEMTIDKKGDYVLFMVKDFGVGIPKDVQDKLFKEMVTTKGKNGTGLGLYISYSIIKSQFKGDIWFDSEPGKGTTFHISIPISKRCDLCE